VTGALKFLEPEAVGPFSRFRWPRPENGGPGPWVEAAATPELCSRGVHACRRETLARWLAAELWQVELEGEVDERGSVLVAGRGRLVGRVEGWGDEVASELMRNCVRRAQELAAAHCDVRVLQELAEEAPGYLDGTWSFETAVEAAAMGSYVVGRAAGVAAAPDGDAERHAAGFDAERERQSLWLADRLGV
jgi:hypothetical protein